MTIKDDLLATLDLLLRRFYSISFPLSKHNLKSQIFIFVRDLERHNLTPEVFAEAIEHFHADGIKITLIGDEDEISQHFNFNEPLEEPERFRVELPSHFLDVQKRLIKSIDTTQPTNSTRVGFKSETGVLKCGDLYKKFQTRSKKGCIPFKLFCILWDARKDKIISKDGFLPATLAVQLNLITSNKDFLHDPKTSIAIDNAIKTIRKKLKGFPVKLERRGGIQLITL